MGQQTSFLEFSQEISKLHHLECKGLTVNDDAPIWKILFLSPMTDDEICSFFNFDDIRTFRRYHPDRLALVLFKCIQQLVGFCEKGSEVSDYCSVMNALRMLGNALPYCFEDLQMKGTKLKESTITSKRTQQIRGEGVKQPSPFAEGFAQHFFWENRTCEGSDLSSVVTVRQQWATGPYHGIYDAPLGEILVNALTKLCFIPRFTVGPLQTPSSTLAASQTVELDAVVASRGTSESVKVFRELLWYGSSVSTGSITFRQVDPRRIQVLRVLIQCMSWNVFVGDDKLANPFLEVLVDDLRCPLAPTLCQTLVNRISTHYSRGAVPYSSYLAADNAEKILEQALSILSIAFEHPNKAVNSFLRVFDVLDSSSANGSAAENFVIGLHRVIDNPLYSSRTYLKESQKVVHCTTEAIVLLFHSLAFDKMRSIFIANASQMIIPLMYVIQEAARDDKKAREAELAMYVLLKLSSEPRFLQGIVNQPVAAQPPLFVLPDLMKAVTPRPVMGDVIILMMCFVISPASPRWFLAMFPAAATVCCNILASISSLTEGTCFEINHALEFLVHKNVLKKGPAAQEACQLWVDGVVSIIDRRLPICVPLYACLGVGSAGVGLKRRIDGKDDAAGLENEPVDPASPIEHTTTMEEGSADSLPPVKKHKAIRFIPNFEAGMPLDELIRISEESKVKLNDSSISVGSTEARSSIYQTIASTASSGLRIAAASDAPLIRQTVVNNELRKWISGSLWRSIHMHNTRPPLYDFRTVKLY